MPDTPNTELQRMLIELVRSTGTSLENLSRSTADSLRLLQRDISEIRESTVKIETTVTGIDSHGSQRTREVSGEVEDIKETLSYAKGALWAMGIGLGGLWALVLLYLSQHGWNH